MLVVSEVFYLFNGRFITQSALSWQGLFGNRHAFTAVGLLIVFQLAFNYLPIFQSWFGTGGPGAQTWLWILGAGLVVFGLVECEKWSLPAEAAFAGACAVSGKQLMRKLQVPAPYSCGKGERNATPRI